LPMTAAPSARRRARDTACGTSADCA